MGVSSGFLASPDHSRSAESGMITSQNGEAHLIMPVCSILILGLQLQIKI